jgi:hypothetical protein
VPIYQPSSITSQATPLDPHIDDIERRIAELYNVSRLKCLSIHVLHIVRMEDARAGAGEDGLFAGRVGEAETAPTVRDQSLCCREEYAKSYNGNCTYLGCFVGAHTMAIDSAIMTWYPTCV